MRRSHRTTGQIFMTAKKTPAKTTTKKKTAPVKRKSASDRAKLAGIAMDEEEKIPSLTVRIKKKGKRGRPKKWDYDKLVTYVCEKISGGKLVSDVCGRIGIRTTTFWNIVETTDTYKVLYAQARKREAESMKIYAQKVAEGRDWITIRERKRIAKIRKDKKSLSSMMHANFRENNIIQRNRLQLDAAKWIAKVTDPEKFGDRSSLSLNGGNDGEPVAVTLRFVDAKGKTVTP